MDVDLRETGALVVRAHKGVPFYEAKWRDPTGQQRKRRLGRAWLEPDPTAAGSAMASSTRSAPTGR
jgi:hypothetical protein